MQSKGSGFSHKSTIPSSRCARLLSSTAKTGTPSKRHNTLRCRGAGRGPHTHIHRAIENQVALVHPDRRTVIIENVVLREGWTGNGVPQLIHLVCKYKFENDSIPKVLLVTLYTSFPKPLFAFFRSSVFNLIHGLCSILGTRWIFFKRMPCRGVKGPAFRPQ